MKKIKPKTAKAVNQKVLIATVDGGKDKHYGYKSEKVRVLILKNGNELMDEYAYLLTLISERL